MSGQGGFVEKVTSEQNLEEDKGIGQAIIWRKIK